MRIHNAEEMDHLQSKGEDIVLNLSMKRLIVDFDEVDYFEDANLSKSPSSKGNSPKRVYKCKYKQLFEKDKLNESDKPVQEYYIQGMNSIIDGSIQVDLTIHDKAESNMMTKDTKLDEYTPGYKNRNQSPNSSISSCPKQEALEDQHCLWRIKEVSFDHSSARPSYKNPKTNDDHLTFNFLAQDPIPKTPEIFLPAPSNLTKKLQPHKIDLARLKRKYLSKPSAGKPHTHLTASVDAVQTAAMPVAMIDYRLKSHDAQAIRSRDDGVCVTVRERMARSGARGGKVLGDGGVLESSRSVWSHRVFGVEKQAELSGRGSSHIRCKGAARLGKHVELSDFECNSNSGSRSWMKKSTFSCKTDTGTRTPLEFSSSINVDRKSNRCTINVRQKLKEQKTARKIPINLLRQTDKNSLIPKYREREQIIDSKSNLFRDPLLQKNSLNSIKHTTEPYSKFSKRKASLQEISKPASRYQR